MLAKTRINILSFQNDDRSNDDFCITTSAELSF